MVEILSTKFSNVKYLQILSGSGGRPDVDVDEMKAMNRNPMTIIVLMTSELKDDWNKI